MTAVLHHSKARGTAKLVLLGIANHQSDRGAWPALSTLQKYAGGVDERNVRRALRQLEDMKELSVQVRGGGDGRGRGGRETNRYWVLVKCPQTCDRTLAHKDLREVDVPFPDV